MLLFFSFDKTNIVLYLIKKSWYTYKKIINAQHNFHWRTHSSSALNFLLKLARILFTILFKMSPVENRSQKLPWFLIWTHHLFRPSAPNSLNHAENIIWVWLKANLKSKKRERERVGFLMRESLSPHVHESIVFAIFGASHCSSGFSLHWLLHLLKFRNFSLFY